MENKKQHKRNENKKLFTFKNAITIILFLFLILNGFYRVLIKQTDLLIDLSASILIISAYLLLFKKWKQDNFSYLIFALTIIVHNMYLYATTIFGIRFDHYMHFLGGFAIALVVDRIYRNKLSKSERIFLAIISSAGIGSIGEIIEWLGYNFLGNGDGFLLYGVGDEGEWQNATLDMLFNVIGGTFAGLFLTKFTKKQKQLNTKKEKQ